MNEAPDLLFQVRFGSLEDAGGEIPDGVSTLMSIAFRHAVPRSILAAGFRWLKAHLRLRRSSLDQSASRISYPLSFSSRFQDARWLGLG